MGVERVGVLVPTQEVAFAIDASGVVQWELEEGRRWLFDEGVLFLHRGNSFYAITRVPNYQAGIQWSLGFGAGRDLPTSLREVPRR